MLLTEKVMEKQKKRVVLNEKLTNDAMRKVVEELRSNKNIFEIDRVVASIYTNLIIEYDLIIFIENIEEYLTMDLSNNIEFQKLQDKLIKIVKEYNV